MDPQFPALCIILLKSSILLFPSGTCYYGRDELVVYEIGRDFRA